MRIAGSFGVAMALTVCLPAARAQTSPVVTRSAQSSAEIDKLARPFINGLMAGDAKRAVDAFVATSPLLASKTIEMDSLRSQIQTALTAYGPITSMELVKEQEFGASNVRRYYVGRHEKMVTRWEFVFSQTSKSWIISYVGFDDQQRTWFE